MSELASYIASAQPDAPGYFGDVTRLAHAASPGELNAAMLIACQHGQLAVLKLLVQRGVDWSYTFGPENALTTVSAAGFTDCLEYLLYEGMDVNSPSRRGQTALHKASFHGRADCVKLLLAKGARVNDVDDERETALFKACGKGQTECARLLLTAGAHVHARNDAAETPLMAAAFAGKAQLCQLLLDRDADVGAQSKEKRLSALILAAMIGKKRTVQVLLERGAPVAAHTIKNESALHYACFRGHADVTRLLLQHGADPAARTVWGVTPLHCAALAGATECISLLLESGASALETDCNGETALAKALSLGRRRAVTVLYQSLSAEQLAELDPPRRGERVLTLAIREARDLPPVEKSDLLSLPKALAERNPYCVVRLGDAPSRKTRRCHRTVSPVWNERFELPLPPASAEQLLEISVMDRRRTATDELLGRVTLDLNKLHDGVRNVRFADWVRVSHVGSAAPRGELLVEIAFSRDS